MNSNECRENTNGVILLKVWSSRDDDKNRIMKFLRDKYSVNVLVKSHLIFDLYFYGRLFYDMIHNFHYNLSECMCNDSKWIGWKPTFRLWKSKSNSFDEHERPWIWVPPTCRDSSNDDVAINTWWRRHFFP